MLLPFREHLDFGPTPYDLLQQKEGIPIVKGNVVKDVTTLELDHWERMGVPGCYLNLSNQQRTDAYVCEIPPSGQTLPQRHLFEEIVYVAKGRGATSVSQEGTAKVTFEWGPGAIFAIPLNATYVHFNGSGNEAIRLFVGTTCPAMINIFHNEDFIFRNPFNFRDRFHEGDEFLRYNKHVTDRYWETNLVPDVNQFPLDDFPMKGKGVKHMRYTLADTTYGCHVSEFPPGCRSTFHRHGPGAVIIITQGEGYVVLWKDGEERQRHEFQVGTVYSPDDLMWHGHFNTGKGNMRHFAMRGDSPKYSHDRFRNPAWTMIPMADEDAAIQREYVEILKKNGVEAAVQVVED
jgi:quercetin dioxygenase-like cupin family protein